MVKIIFNLLVATTLAAAVLGLAASLGALTTANLFSSSQDAANCDPNGVTVSAVSGNKKITSVTVSGIADACRFGVVVVQLANLGGTVKAAGQAPVSVLSGPTDDNSIEVVPTADGTGSGKLVTKAAGAVKIPLVTGGTVSIDSTTLAITVTP